MPFDPKLIHPEETPLDAAGELDLPADLAELGEQLRSDAASLSTRYPAAEGPAAANARVVHVRPLRGRVYAAGAALATVLAALLVAIVLWQRLPGSHVAVHGLTTAPPVAPTATTSTAPVAAATAAAPVASNPISLADLSGPELEALVDLLAREPERGHSISF